MTETSKYLTLKNVTLDPIDMRIHSFILFHICDSSWEKGG